MYGTVYALATASSVLSEGQTDIFYVGATKRSLAKRLAGHLKNSDATQSRKALRITDILSSGDDVVILEISSADSREELELLERNTYLDFRQIYDLTNAYVPRFLSNMKPTEVTRSKQSAALVERYKDPEQRKKVGRVLSSWERTPEYRAANRERTLKQLAQTPHVECPTCGMTGLPGIIAMHRSRRNH